MATSAQRVHKPRIHNNQENKFEGTINNVQFKANNFRLINNDFAGEIGPHWEARVHQRAVNFTYKEVSIYIPIATADGEHALDSTTKIVVSYVDYSDPQNPVAHKSVAGDIKFTLDKENKVFGGSLNAVMDSYEGDGSETFTIAVENFLILGK